MADKGWIALHRSMQEHWLWEETRKFSKAEAWLDLLMSASHKTHTTIVNDNIMTVERGKMVASVRFLQVRWGWSNTKVVRFLKLLTESDMVSTEKETGVTVINIRNYNEYQTEQKEKKTQKRQGKDAEKTQKRQRDDEDNNGNNVTSNLSLSKGIENPTLDQILKLVGSTPYPLTEEIAQAYFHARESVGWIKANQTITNWQADIAGFAQRWMNNERSKPKTNGSRNRNSGPPHSRSSRADANAGEGINVPFL